MEAEGVLKRHQITVDSSGGVESDQVQFTPHTLTVGGQQASKFHQRGSYCLDNTVGKTCELLTPIYFKIPQTLHKEQVSALSCPVTVCYQSSLLLK